MSRIATCPACHGELSIPATAQIADQMRCPHCQVQFAVATVLAGSVEAPPEALPVEPPLPNVSAAVGPSLSRVEDLSDLHQHTARSAPVREPRGPSLLGQLIGIVGGGAVGLTIGYVVLLRFGGPQYDFLSIADKLPRWALPPAREPERKSGPEGADQGAPQRSLSDLLENPQQPPQAELPVEPPLPTDPPPAVGPGSPLEPSAPPLGLRTVVTYTSDQLGAALAEANAAVGCEHCNSTGVVKRTVVTGVREENGKKVEQTTEKRMPCEVCGGKPSPKITPEVYQKLSRLAEVATCVEVGAGATSSWHRREGVQNLLLKVGGDPQRAETIGRLAGFQLDDQAREHSGVALAGTVQDVGKEGPLHFTRLVLFGLPKTVTVISSSPPQPAIDLRDRVIILGSIVDNPRENIVGYEGSLPQVVWGGLPVKLPAAPP